MSCSYNRLPEQSLSFARGDSFNLPFIVEASQYPLATVVSLTMQLSAAGAEDADAALYSQQESVAVTAGEVGGEFEGSLLLLFPVDGTDTAALATGQVNFILRDNGRDEEIARGTVELTAGARAAP